VGAAPRAAGRQRAPSDGRRAGGGRGDGRASAASGSRAPRLPGRAAQPADAMASETEDLNSREAQSVCEALGRYEDTLRGVVREIHVDIQVFKQGVGRQVEEVLRLASPLAHTVSELQQENRRLRAQLERLARQVEALGRSAGLPQERADEAAGSAPAAGPGSPGQGSAGGRFPRHAKLAVAGRSQVSAGGGRGGGGRGRPRGCVSRCFTGVAWLCSVA